MYQRPTLLPIMRQSQPTVTRYSGFMCTKTMSYCLRSVKAYQYKRITYFNRNIDRSPLACETLAKEGLPSECTETFLGSACRPSLRQMTCTCSAFFANSSIQ